MALARMVAPSNVRRLVVVLSTVSALAFMLGQGVAAYQAVLVRRPVAILEHMANQVQAQVTEQIAIARGVTPTPTVRVTGNRPAAHNSGAHRAVTTTAALSVPRQQPANVMQQTSDTQQASDAQKGKHGDSNGDTHQNNKQKSDQPKGQDTSGANGQSGDQAGGSQGSDNASAQGSDKQKSDKHKGGGDQSSGTSADTSNQQ